MSPSPIAFQSNALYFGAQPKQHRPVSTVNIQRFSGSGFDSDNYVQGINHLRKGELAQAETALVKAWESIGWGLPNPRDQYRPYVALAGEVLHLLKPDFNIQTQMRGYGGWKYDNTSELAPFHQALQSAKFHLRSMDQQAYGHAGRVFSYLLDRGILGVLGAGLDTKYLPENLWKLDGSSCNSVQGEVTSGLARLAVDSDLKVASFKVDKMNAPHKVAIFYLPVEPSLAEQVDELNQESEHQVTLV